MPRPRSPISHSPPFHFPSTAPPLHTQVYGYEPGLKNFELCGRIREAHPDAAWHLYRMAVADKVGTATFPADQDETGAIGGAGVETEITTVDTILAVNKLDHVDMYGSLDIILDHFAPISQLCATPPINPPWDKLDVHIILPMSI